MVHSMIVRRSPRLGRAAPLQVSHGPSGGATNAGKGLGSVGMRGVGEGLAVTDVPGSWAFGGPACSRTASGEPIGVLAGGVGGRLGDDVHAARIVTVRKCARTRCNTRRAACSSQRVAHSSGARGEVVSIM